LTFWILSFIISDEIWLYTKKNNPERVKKMDALFTLQLTFSIIGAIAIVVFTVALGYAIYDTNR
jgi:hypothetical protein